MRFTLSASYDGCVINGNVVGLPSAAIPRCGRGGRIPSLPPGKYQAVLFGSDDLPVTPAPAPVRVLAASTR